MYLISGLGTGEGISWSDAISAAASVFTSTGSSTLLEVIASSVSRLGSKSDTFFVPVADWDFEILPVFITRCRSQSIFIGQRVGPSS